MSTWHQQRNSAAMSALYSPDKFRWKVIDNPPGRMASVMAWETEEQAKEYQSKCGGVIIPPVNP